MQYLFMETKVVKGSPTSHGSSLVFFSGFVCVRCLACTAVANEVTLHAQEVMCMAAVKHVVCIAR